MPHLLPRARPAAAMEHRSPRELPRASFVLRQSLMALVRCCVARTDNKSWSLYGAPWLQPVATGGKSDRRGSGENKREPLPSVATGCRSERMVRRGSTVRVRQRATIEYWPAALCLESKSLKLYLSGFRNEGAFCEALAVKIRDDIAAALELPADKVRVTLKQKARGGITITATS